jgi:DNA adenine methylase
VAARDPALAAIPLASLSPPRLDPAPTLAPFLKWPGGKSRELPAIAAAAPPLTGRLIDPFVGGGAILLATPPHVPAWANDASPDLVGIYRAVADADAAFLDALGALGTAWEDLGHAGGLHDDLVAAFLDGDPALAGTALRRHRAALAGILDPVGPDLADRFLTRAGREIPRKLARMRTIERTVGRRLSAHDLRANVEGAVRASMYTSIRDRYNDARRAGRYDTVRLVDFFALRELAYAAMFRFNTRGDFNVPYGGITYNGKSLGGRRDQLADPLLVARLANTTIRCGDFEPFLDEASPTEDDFVFIDPPYDSDFSAYDALAFDASDQRRLRDVLERIQTRVMVVIKETPAIRALYRPDRWQTVATPKTYAWTIKSRNDRSATHLTLTNYSPMEAASPVASSQSVHGAPVSLR